MVSPVSVYISDWISEYIGFRSITIDDMLHSEFQLIATYLLK